jgi:hypothetical protein
MIEGQFIICPNCALIGKKQILGKLLNNGDFLVLRFSHGTTIIRAMQYSIVCGCGFNHNVSGAVTIQDNQQHV